MKKVFIFCFLFSALLYPSEEDLNHSSYSQLSFIFLVLVISLECSVTQVFLLDEKIVKIHSFLALKYIVIDRLCQFGFTNLIRKL